MMKITFLGTGSMIPTPERNQVSLFLEYRDEGILVDCGEGTQRQFRIAGITPTKITKILITHWHGDHTLGLGGLLSTLGAHSYSKVLEIYGPKGTKKFISALFKLYIPQTRIKYGVIEVTKRRFFENEWFYLEALRLVHPVACLGYSFIEKDRLKINTSYLSDFGLRRHPILKKLQRGEDIAWKGKKIPVKKATTVKKGKKVTFISDTNFCENILKLSSGSDVLICESTHLEELKERTERYKHLTAKQAGEIAKKAKASKLILTHYSQRYKKTKPLLDEAKEAFTNTYAAEDFSTFEI